MIPYRGQIKEAVNDRLFMIATGLITFQFIMGLYEIFNPLSQIPLHWLVEIPAVFLLGIWFRVRRTLTAERIIQLSLLLNYGFTVFLCIIGYSRMRYISQNAFFFSLGVTAMFTTVLYSGYVAGSLRDKAGGAVRSPAD